VHRKAAQPAVAGAAADGTRGGVDRGAKAIPSELDTPRHAGRPRGGYNGRHVSSNRDAVVERVGTGTVEKMSRAERVENPARIVSRGTRVDGEDGTARVPERADPDGSHWGR
jgi:hypothetical protein